MAYTLDPKRDFTPHQLSKDDIFSIDFSTFVVVESKELLSIIRGESYNLKKRFGITQGESLSFANWIVRKLFEIQGLQVPDLREDMVYSNAFEYLAKREHFSFVGQVNYILEKKRFRPTMMQCFCTLEGIFFHFGAGYDHFPQK